MLAHQLTAAHFGAMKLLETSQQPRLPAVELARLTNAAARQMDIYQAGCLVLQKLKARGQQRVVVQYPQVNVGDGGQAVVTGTVKGGLAPRRGCLLNGNPPGDPAKAPRCGAKTRRSTAFSAPAMANGRCRLHGGPSTGPRTLAGLERSRRARWKHGFYSRAAKDERARMREEYRSLCERNRRAQEVLLLAATRLSIL